VIWSTNTHTHTSWRAVSYSLHWWWFDPQTHTHTHTHTSWRAVSYTLHWWWFDPQTHTHTSWRAVSCTLQCWWFDPHTHTHTHTHTSWRAVSYTLHWWWFDPHTHTHTLVDVLCPVLCNGGDLTHTHTHTSWRAVSYSLHWWWFDLAAKDTFRLVVQHARPRTNSWEKDRCRHLMNTLLTSESKVVPLLSTMSIFYINT